MHGALTRSLASWGDANGFVVLCIRPPQHEHFVIVAVDETKLANLTDRGFRLWTGMSEAELHEHFLQVGLSEIDAVEAIEIAREWATTVTREPGSRPLLWDPLWAAPRP